jgi:hypothetical protein
MNGGDKFSAHLVVRPGDSGGGVFTADGKLVAIATAYVTEQPDIALGTGLPAIRRLVERVCWPRWKYGRQGSVLPARPTSPPASPILPSQETERIVRLEERLSTIEKGLEQMKTAGGDRAAAPAGKPGEPGPAGPPGPKGDSGKDADTSALNQRIARLEALVNNFSTKFRVRVDPVQRK